MKPAWLKEGEVDVWVPISLELDDPTEDSVVEEILEQHRSDQLSRFLLAFPSGGWRSVGFPPREHFVRRAQLFSRVKERLAKENIQCGWWITATLLSGTREDFTPMTDPEGKPSLHANCPLDERFRREFSQCVALAAHIGRPDLIMTEDDYSVHAGSSQFGCFCPLHMAEFSRRMGREYRREELAALFRERKEEAFPLLRAWRELMRDSLVGLAEQIRRAVDEKTPEIPMGYMQSGGADLDGDCTMAVSRALAGERHAPFSRLYGTSYCGGSAKDLPRVMYHPLYTKEHHPELVPYHESDSFPHTLYFMSAGHLLSMMYTAYSAGFVGSVFQTQQLLDDANEEKAYASAFARERERLRALMQARKGCRMRGVQLCYDPFWNTAEPYGKRPDPLWARPVGLMGIPYVTTPERVALWDARQAKRMDDAAVEEYLSKGLILDGAAARILCERGYGAYLGVQVERESLQPRDLLDLAAREVLKEGYLPQRKGRHLPSPHMFAKGNNGKLQTLTVTHPDCEVLSRLFSFEGKELGPVVTRFENALGGRVAVLGFTLCDEATGADNLSQSLYSYRRQAMLQELVAWCGGDYVTVEDQANVFLLMNEAEDEKTVGVLTLIRLGEDTAEGVKLCLPKGWQGASWLVLEADGSWRKARWEATPTGVQLRESIPFGKPLILQAVREE